MAGAGRGGASADPGRLSLDCLTVVDLVREAYIRNASGQPGSGWYTQIEGGPAWTRSDRYAIDAKPESPQSRATMAGPMLQALLEDRFHLKVHREAREIPVYILNVARGGLKLRAVPEADCQPLDPEAIHVAFTAHKPPPRSCGSIWFGAAKERPGELLAQAHGLALEAFSKNLSRILDRPVIDRTGISGLIDYAVEFAPDETTPRFLPGANQGWLAAQAGAASDPADPTFRAALVRQSGLRLDPAKGPGEFLVIDHVERPSEN